MFSKPVGASRSLGAGGSRLAFPRRIIMWAKYRSFDEFERDEIRPGLRLGWSLDNINDPTAIDLDFDEDPFERALLESENESDEDSESLDSSGDHAAR
jgi:hypothetical protein